MRFITLKNMDDRKPVSLSFCETCGTKVFSRDELCSVCKKLPLCDDRYNLFVTDKNFDTNEWNEELITEYQKWLFETSPKFCKDCGMNLDDIETTDVIDVDKRSGDLIYGDNHHCNPHSPLYY